MVTQTLYESNNLMRRMSVYAANITGSNAFWYQKRQELHRKFLNYSGPQFFSNDGRKNWLPFEPIKIFNKYHNGFTIITNNIITINFSFVLRSDDTQISRFTKLIISKIKIH
jgi:hypothetical protein